MMRFKIIVSLLILIQILGFIPNLSIINPNISAIDTIYENTELKPSFSALDIDIDDSLIISYEDIDTSDYECSLTANGITATVVENSDYLQCEVEAIEGVEFGELTVSG